MCDTTSKPDALVSHTSLTPVDKSQRIYPNARALLHVVMLLVLLLITTCFSSPAQAARPLPVKDVQAAMSTIKTRYIAQLLAEPADFAQATQLAASLKNDGSWAALNYKDLSRTGYENARHLVWLRVMALAYRKAAADDPQRAFYRAATFEALNHWLKHDYIAENWWLNDIGNPRRLTDTLLLLDDEISDAQRATAVRLCARANLQSEGARPGGDIVQIAQIMTKWAVLSNDAHTMQLAAATISKDVHLTTGRGMQYDHSFHHRTDKVIQTTGYGRGFIEAVANFAAMAANTVFEVPQDKLKLLIDEELDGTRWIMAFGRIPSPASMNRNISRPAGMNPWTSQTPLNLLAATDYRRDELENLAKVRQGQAAPAWSGNRYYWCSTYMAHQRQTYHAAVRMFSSRNANTEGPINLEGLKNHHLADGSCFVMRTGNEYIRIAPFMDFQKVPGTTILQKPRIHIPGLISRKGLSAFTGGVTDGQYGASAMDFISPIDPIAARKAWFFFDKQIIALGSDIRFNPQYPRPQAHKPDPDAAKYDVVTTLNQTSLQGDVIVHQNNQTALLTPGRRELANVQWVHHDHIGYVFFAPTTANLHNSGASGNWRSLNLQSDNTNDIVKGNLFTLWLNHGPSPANASYAYAIFPEISLADMQAQADKPGVKIIANTRTLQAVMLEEPQVIQAVFYEPERLAFELALPAPPAADADTNNQKQPAQEIVIRAMSRCMLMIRPQGNQLLLSVSDPTQSLRSITFDIATRISSADDKNPWQGGPITIQLPTGPMAGQSVTQAIKWPGR